MSVSFYLIETKLTDVPRDSEFHEWLEHNFSREFVDALSIQGDEFRKSVKKLSKSKQKKWAKGLKEIRRLIKESKYDGIDAELS